MSIVTNSSENCNRHAAGAVFTLFLAAYPISKRFRLNGSGLEKITAMPIGKGTAHLIRIASLDDLASLLDGLGANEAVGFGIPRCLADKDGEASIALAARAKLNGAECIARLKETFTHPEGMAIFWGDIDRAKGQKEVPEAAEIDALLCAALPWWSGVDRFYRPSVSAHIHSGNLELNGRTGMRVYALIDKGTNSEAILAIVADALWKQGQGWIEHSKDGKRLVRCLFDLSKTSPESLDYAGQPLFETPGLAKEYVAPVFYGPAGAVIDSGEVIAGAQIGRLTVAQWRKQSAEVRAALEAALPAEKRLRKAFVEVRSAEDVARAKVEAAAKGETFDEDAARKRSRALWSGAAFRDALSAHFVIELQDGSRVTAGEILADIERFDLQYCHDPIDPAYNNGHASVAQIHARDRPHIWSFAHGGRYYSLGSERPEPEQERQERRKPALRVVDGGGGGRNGSGAAGEDASAAKNEAQPKAKEFPAPCSEGELTPVMNLLDKALFTAEAEPPMRSVTGWPVEVELREPIGLHELTAAGSNDNEAEQSRLPAPKSYVLSRHNVCTLALLIERYARFYVETKDEDGRRFRVYKRLPRAFVTHFLEFKKSRLPKVSGLMTMPLVLANGKLLAKSGLDRGLKTVFCLEPEIVQLLPEAGITESQITGAIRFLTDEWLADVPTDYAGKCILIALALSVLERQLLGERPAFFVTAGKRGTGKTTAVTMIALALTGKRAAAAAWSPKEEERRKAVFAALLQSVALIVWDNIRLGSTISCPTIEKALTSAELEDRVLGESRSERASCAAIQVFTGNNIAPKGDMASRSLNIRLNADRPDPENRAFKHPDPFEWTLAHRGSIIKALYTVLLGNPRFGQAPKEQAVPKTRFKQWWHLVGAAIEHAAMLAGNAIDFGQAFLDTEAEDEESTSLAEVLTILDRISGKKHFLASEVALWLGHGTDDAATLKSFFTDREGIIPSARTIGRKLKAITDAPVWCDEAVLSLNAAKDAHTKMMNFSVKRTY